MTSFCPTQAWTIPIISKPPWGHCLPSSLPLPLVQLFPYVTPFPSYFHLTIILRVSLNCPSFSIHVINLIQYNIGKHMIQIITCSVFPPTMTQCTQKIVACQMGTHTFSFSLILLLLCYNLNSSKTKIIKNGLSSGGLLSINFWT